MLNKFMIENPSGFPPELLGLDQWVCWRYVNRDGKRTKAPFTPDGRAAKSNRADTWTSYKNASSAAGFDGVGFMFDGEHVGIDLDHCIDQKTGEIEPDALAIVNRVDSYTELSPSGTGLHIFCRGQLKGSGRRRGNVEVYGAGRYFTVTMRPYGEPRQMREASAEIAAVIAEYIDKPKRAGQRAAKVNEGQRRAQTVKDDDLLDRIRNSKQGACFAALWKGDTSAYHGDDSAADLALCNILAFWTGKDAARMDDLFRQSGLMRGKWDERHGPDTYGQMTIRRAIDGTTETYREPKRIEAPDLPQMSEEGSPFRRFEEAYQHVNGYLASRGMLYAVTQAKGEIQTAPLAKFIAVLTEITTRDNGVETCKEFCVEGINNYGEPLPPVNVLASRFSAMTWPLEAWGVDANIYPGMSCKEKLRFAIMEAGHFTASRRTVYEHTGWRKIAGKWAYLYNGGAIGADGLSVELEGALGRYSLPEHGGSMTPTRELLNVLPRRVAIPLLAHVFLAPLREFLSMAGCTPAFILFLAGATGAKKSTIAALGLSHYGAGFDGQHLPASFHDTQNALRRKAFSLKDALLIIDDLHPTSDPRERRTMDGSAQAMARAWGDLAERGRLRADTSFQKEQPPRGLGMMTGEDLPDVGESGLARFFLVEIGRAEITVDDRLSDLQQRASRGEFAASMRTYLEWLLPRADDLPGKLGDAFRKYRSEARARLVGTHDRQPAAVAWLMIGFETALDCMVDHNELTDAQREDLRKEAFETLINTASEQQRDMAQASPCKLFISTLLQMEAAGDVSFVQLGGYAPPISYQSAAQNIGYKDEDFYYLHPVLAYGAVNDVLRDNGTSLPVSRGRLWRQMGEAGLIELAPNGDTSKTKKVGPKDSPRVVWLKRQKAESLA